MYERARKRLGPLLWLAGRSRPFCLDMLLLLPVLYVVSFGPACWAFGWKRGSPFLRAYAPIVWIHDRVMNVWDPPVFLCRLRAARFLSPADESDGEAPLTDAPASSLEHPEPDSPLAP